MNDMSSIPALAPAVAWPSPIINHPRDALEVAGGHSERLIALLGAVVSGINDDILPDCLSSSSMVTAYLQLCIVQEKLEELDKLIAAIVEAMPGPVSSVGKHVEIARRQDWRAAVDRLDAVKLLPVTEANDETIGDEASRALTAVIETRAISPGQFREKLEIIRREDVFLNHGVVDAIFADLDALGWSSARQVEG